MKVLFRLLLCSALCGFTPVMASMISVSGDVSGIWSADTVLVTDSVRVAQRQPGNPARRRSPIPDLL